MGDRLEREIREILINYEKHARRHGRRRRRASIRERLRARLYRIRLPRTMPGGGQLMLLGFIVILFAFSFSPIMPGVLKQWILVAGVLLFALGLLVAILRSSRHPASEMRWRGRVIRMDDQRPRRGVRGWFRRG